nr:fibrohexamerin-like protein 4 [Pseudoips prasinana]
MKVLGYLTFLVGLYSCSGTCYDGVYRPCRLWDLRCIGRVFARELRCNLVQGEIPDSRILKYLPLDYPSSNSSILYRNAQATGLSDFTVNEFYINRNNNTLVMEVVFRQLDVESPDTTGYFYRKGKEPVVTNGYCSTIYNNYSLTLTVFNVDGRRNRRRCDYQVYTYVTDANAPLGYSKSFVPTDPEALNEYNVFFDNLGLSLQEEAINQGPLLMSYILPCDLQLSVFPK